MAVLTLNAGSSSLKFALFDRDRATLRGAFTDITHAPEATAKTGSGQLLDPPQAAGTGHEAVLPALLAWIGDHLDGARLDAFGHRIVHGGDRFTGPARITDDVLAGIEALNPLAPLHQPHAIAAIRIARQQQPTLPQVASFDTAFHHTLPPHARDLPIPPQPAPDGLTLRRYGFHGLSYQYIAAHLPPGLARGRVIAAHLGSGASLCALQAGISIETTMSTTPLDGLLMGTRCGTLDPGAVLYLLQHTALTPQDLERLLYTRSGLQALAGAPDMPALHRQNSPSAHAAIDLFTYRVAQHAAALAAALGGLDGVIFTGGIGEHDGEIRAAICARLRWLGLHLDPAANAPGRISTQTSPVALHVIPTDEEAVIAAEAVAVLAAG